MQCSNCDNAATCYHHIVPKALGGTDRPTNLAPLCDACHGLVHGKDITKMARLSRIGQQAAIARGVKFGAKRKFTPEQQAALRRYYADGWTIYDLSDFTGLSKSTVYRIVKQY